jgi:hypothetical protein
MTRASAVLACLLAVPTPRAAGEPPHSLDPAGVRAELGAILEEAGRRNEELAAFLKETAAAAPLPADFGLLSDRAATYAYCLQSPLTAGNLSHQEVELYEACTGLIGGGEAACAQTDGSANKKNCQKIYWDLALTRNLLLGRPDSESICRESLRRKVPGLSDKDGAFYCAALVGKSDRRATCAALAAGLPAGETKLESCLNTWEMYYGEGECAHFRVNEYQQRLCTAAHRAKQALASGAPRLCGDSSFCQALLGEPESCTGFLRTLKETACRSFAPPSAAAAEIKPAFAGERLVSQIRSAIGQTDGASLDDRERAAASRLDAVMLGRKPLRTVEAQAEIVALREGRLKDLFSRARELLQVLNEDKAEDPARRPLAARLAELEAAERKLASSAPVTRLQLH